MTRAAGALLLACAAALAALPAFDWFAVDVPGGRASASGLAVSGVLWLVPPLAVIVAAAGAALMAAAPARRRRVGRWAGPTALLAAVLALAASLWAALDGGVSLTVTAENVSGPVAVAVEREPAAWWCAAAAMASSAVALAVSALAWRP